MLENDSILNQFILDCTSLNLPRRINQNNDVCLKMFNLGCDLCFSMTKKRNEALKNLKK